MRFKNDGISSLWNLIGRIHILIYAARSLDFLHSQFVHPFIEHLDLDLGWV